MATPLPRPGVEIVQEVTPESVTPVATTLVPCIVGPAYEVVNALKTNGSLNPKALHSVYGQVPKLITQLQFPDPRNNIAELDIVESSIRTFIQAFGKLTSLPMSPGSAFLAALHRASAAAMRTKVFSGATGLALAGKTLVLAIDVPAASDASQDVIVTFTGTANLTSADAAAQINAAVGATVATVVGSSPSDRVQITSPSFGALSSVTVRAGGSANAVLELGYYSSSAAHEERVEGAGFRAQDQSNNTTLSSWIEFSRGAFLRDGTSTTLPATYGFVNLVTGAFQSSIAGAVTFAGSSPDFPVVAGDFVFADGLRVSGEVMKVEVSRFRVGTIDTERSIADENGNYTTKVYKPANLGTIFATTPFSPKFFYAQAQGLVVDDLAPVAATLTGSEAGVAATAAIVTGSGAAGGPFAIAGLTLDVLVTVDGVESSEHFIITGGPFADMTAVAAAISIPGVLATAVSGQLRLATSATGRLQAISVLTSGTANATLGFSTTSATSDEGTDVSFDARGARLVSGTITFPAALSGLTLIIERSTDGGLTYPSSTTHTFLGSIASISALIADLTADNTFTGSGAHFTVTGASGVLTIKGTPTGALKGLRVGASSTALTLLQLTSGQEDLGEDALEGSTFEFTLNSNPHVYETVFDSSSLDLAVVAINELVGATVAAKDTTGTKLVLTSFLRGAASSIEITSSNASTQFGLASTATGSGRPLPDAYLDDSNELHIGGEILRDLVTGAPLDQSYGTGSLYVQFRALRLDVTARAAEAGVLNIPDLATLQEVLDPITEENPLGLALFLAMNAAPGVATKAVGVASVSATAPYGTLEGYAEAADMLKSQEVYAISVCSDDPLVGALFDTHVDTYSSPEYGGERVAVIAQAMPTRKTPTLAASGSEAGSTASDNQLLLDTNPAAGLVEAGVNPALPLTVAHGVYLEFEVDGSFRRYSVSGVTGPLANLRTTFASGENTDGFYSTAPFTETVVNAAYSLKVRGGSLNIPGSSRRDYTATAVAVAGAVETYRNRRLVAPFSGGHVKVKIDGVEKRVPTFYASAIIAGMTASQRPQQPFTNLPLPGLTGVADEMGHFTKSDLDLMAGGGVYLLIQDTDGGPVICRQQVTTNTDAVEVREFSITRQLDSTAKTIRALVRRFIGSRNIDTDLLNELSLVVQGVATYLVDEAKTLKSATPGKIYQVAGQIDALFLDFVVEPHIPCNKIRITIKV